MKTINQKLQNLLKLGFVILGLWSFAACSDESDPMQPEITKISGKWDGAINHPGYDSGTISFTILQSDNDVSGTFTMRLVKGNSIQNYGGNIDGAEINNQNYNLWLIGSNFTWICDLNLNSNTLSGDWESSSNSLSGSLSLQKN